MPLPAIAHWDGDHWLVAVSTSPARHVRLADPALGIRQVPRDEFAAPLDGLRRAVRLHAAIRARAGRGLGHRLDVAVRAAVTRLLLWRALALAGIVSMLQMMLPVFTQVIVDRVLVEQDVSLLNLLIAGMGVTMVFMVASLAAQRYLLQFAAVRIDAGGARLPDAAPARAAAVVLRDAGARATSSAGWMASGRSAISWCRTASRASPPSCS